MDRRVSNSLRRIEQSLDEIDNPRIFPKSIFWEGRTISSNAKFKELDNLTQRLREIQGAIKPGDSEHEEWALGLESRIEERINKIFNPRLLKTEAT